MNLGVFDEPSEPFYNVIYTLLQLNESKQTGAGRVVRLNADFYFWKYSIQCGSIQIAKYFSALGKLDLDFRWYL